MGVNYLKKYQKLVFQKVGKSQNKFAVAVDIQYINEIVLSKIGQGYELRQNKVFIKKIDNDKISNRWIGRQLVRQIERQKDRQFKLKKYCGGYMGGCV